MIFPEKEGTEMKITVEICCGSADDVWAAKEAGADRVELNSALFLGGLTPTVGTLETAKAAGLPVMAMVRPRGGGFCYSQREYTAMLRDAEVLLSHGADGIVFGFLTPDGELDLPRCKEMANLIGAKTKVFHRAIDVVPNWRETLDALIDLGVDRVLTSGQEPTVAEGAECVREMVDYAQGRIEILPGAGFTVKNAPKLLAQMGCDQMHIALPRAVPETSVSNNRAIYYGGALYPPENLVEVADSAQIAALMAALEK